MSATSGAASTNTKVSEPEGKQTDAKAGNKSKKGKKGSKKASSKANKEAAEQSDEPSESASESSGKAIDPSYTELPEPPTTSHYQSERDDRWVEASNAQQYDFYGYVLAHIECSFALINQVAAPLPPFKNPYAGLRPYHYLALEGALKLPRDKLADLLDLSLETLQKRIVGERFSVRETELLLRLYRLMVVVDEKDARKQNFERLGEWLLVPHGSLWDKVPLTLLEVELGAALVFRALLAEEWVMEIEVRKRKRQQEASAGSTD